MTLTEPNLSTPIFSSIAHDFIDGKPIKRLMLCYRTIGCAHYRSEGGGCSMCAFPASSTGDIQVPVEMLKKQLTSELEKVGWDEEGLEELDIFCAGSFFNDEEIPEKARIFTFETAKQLSNIKKLLVESRPEYITGDKIEKGAKILGPDIDFEIAIGLESASSRVRDDIINKGFGLEEFEASLKLIGEANAHLLVYIFLKPPGITEREAYYDTLESIKYVFKKANELGIKKVTAAVQPAFVQGEGYLHDLYVEGNYKPPWLWTIVKLLKEADHLGEIQIGTSEDHPPPIAVRSNCPVCNEQIEEAIETYNRTQDIRVFKKIECECMEQWSEETELTP